MYMARILQASQYHPKDRQICSRKMVPLHLVQPHHMQQVSCQRRNHRPLQDHRDLRLPKRPLQWQGTLYYYLRLSRSRRLRREAMSSMRHQLALRWQPTDLQHQSWQSRSRLQHMSNRSQAQMFRRSFNCSKVQQSSQHQRSHHQRNRACQNPNGCNSGSPPLKFPPIELLYSSRIPFFVPSVPLVFPLFR